MAAETVTRPRTIRPAGGYGALGRAYGEDREGAAGEAFERPPRSVATSTRVEAREAVTEVASSRIASAWGWVPLAAMALMSVAIGLQPEDASDPAMTFADWVFAGTFLAVLGGAYVWGSVRAFRGSRSGLVLSFPGTALLLIVVLSCPSSGHHPWGNWVIGSFGSAIGAALIHGAALGLTYRSPTATERSQS